MSKRPITLPGTEVHRLHSDVVGDDYEISVIPPPSGFASGPVPVVYVLDGNRQIGRAFSTVYQLIPAGEIGPVYVVGIGYPRGQDPAVFYTLRTRDLSAAKNEELAATTGRMWGVNDVPTGGAEKFLAFLTSELGPFLAERYQIADDSTIVGHSAGAIFAAWVLFHHTDAFQRCIIASPAPLGDDDAARWEEEYASAHTDLDARVFLAVGGDEDVPGPFSPEPLVAEISRVGPMCIRLTRHLGKAFESRRYPNLRLETHVVSGMTHWTISGFAFPQGLRYVFVPD